MEPDFGLPSTAANLYTRQVVFDGSCVIEVTV